MDADKQEQKSASLRHTYRQYLAAAAANLSSFVIGCAYTWPSPMLPRMRDDPQMLNLTTSQESLVGSLVMFPSALGSIPTAVIVYLVGCRIAFQVLAAMTLLGWILTAVASTTTILLVARFFMGIASGSMVVLVPMYCGEIAQDQVRGRLGCFLRIQVSLGGLLIYSIGPYVSYLTVALVSAVFPVALFLSMLLLPDSPYKLVARGQHDKALEALMWLRCCSSLEAQHELQLIQSFVTKTIQEEGTFCDLFRQRANRKALLLMLFLFLFQQMTGMSAVTVYNETIFRESGVGLDASVSAIIVGVVMFIGSSGCSLIVDHVGRRPLLLASSIGMIVSMSLLGTFFYWKANNSDLTNITWLPVTALVAYVIFYDIGFGTVPLALFGEVFSPAVKNKASTICSIWFTVSAALPAQFFQSLAESLGMHGVFWFFGTMALVAGVFTYFFLPETKEKPMHIVHEIFSK